MAAQVHRLRIQLGGSNDAAAAALVDTCMRHVTENLLCIKCPGGHVFNDFDGCFLLTCRCGLAFCAYCLTRLASGQHQHVTGCRQNRMNPGRVSESASSLSLRLRAVWR